MFEQGDLSLSFLCDVVIQIFGKACEKGDYRLCKSHSVASTSSFPFDDSAFGLFLKC